MVLQNTSIKDHLDCQCRSTLSCRLDVWAWAAESGRDTAVFGYLSGCLGRVLGTTCTRQLCASVVEVVTRSMSGMCHNTNLTPVNYLIGCHACHRNHLQEGVLLAWLIIMLCSLAGPGRGHGRLQTGCRIDLSQQHKPPRDRDYSVTSLFPVPACLTFFPMYCRLLLAALLPACHASP